MAAYIIVDGEVTDSEKMDIYKAQAKPLVEKFGGEYLARGGALAVKENQRWTPHRLVLLKFPSMAQAEAFYNAPEYQALLPLSREASRRSLVLFEGV
ncbi:COG5470 Uncharacterized conserved protein [Burkholderiaceae bacterium]|jgi:uncharacterized protein (DUF1330 family)|nr:DUF1330 domain-containing protein [Limnohabitans sp.]MBP8021246.1 DUF1330 domain-containing protein [Limnohabitans sp.]